jgi:hypothetical protein
VSIAVPERVAVCPAGRIGGFFVMPSGTPFQLFDVQFPPNRRDTCDRGQNAQFTAFV